MVGTTRETVTATLSRFVREGPVRTGRRQIPLCIRDAGERLADSLDGELGDA